MQEMFEAIILRKQTENFPYLYLCNGGEKNYLNYSYKELTFTNSYSMERGRLIFEAGYTSLSSSLSSSKSSSDCSDELSSESSASSSDLSPSDIERSKLFNRTLVKYLCFGTRSLYLRLDVRRTVFKNPSVWWPLVHTRIVPSSPQDTITPGFAGENTTWLTPLVCPSRDFSGSIWTQTLFTTEALERSFQLDSDKIFSISLQFHILILPSTLPQAR
mmetsp:Transcript_14241/g.18660  ORF Transcript_14241/g.18660 Transcript_14241/m.18660 type:complete len:217 (-) Transcript_14241:792-1442(-)